MISPMLVRKYSRYARVHEILEDRCLNLARGVGMVAGWLDEWMEGSMMVELCSLFVMGKDGA